MQNCDAIYQYWIRYSIRFSADFSPICTSKYTIASWWVCANIFFVALHSQPTNTIECPKRCQISYFWCMHMGGIGFSFGLLLLTLALPLPRLSNGTVDASRHRNYWDIQYQSKTKSKRKQNQNQMISSHLDGAKLDRTTFDFILNVVIMPGSLAKTQNHNANINARKSRVVRIHEQCIHNSMANWWIHGNFLCISSIKCEAFYHFE